MVLHVSLGKKKCTIKVSAPMVHIRTREELIDTLLHQMIHAYIFVRTHCKSLHHGPSFCKFVQLINKRAGCNMTGIYDTKCEFDIYNSHWWQCDGPCKNWPKRYGFVKRKRNVAPGPLDSWWQWHKARCGGKFRKIQEPTETTTPDCTARCSRALPKENENNREAFKENPSADIPVNETQNACSAAGSSNEPQSTIVFVVKTENNEIELYEVAEEGEHDEQQNANVAGKSDNKQPNHKKKTKGIHAFLLMKHRMKWRMANKRGKHRHSTVAGTKNRRKKEQNQTFTVEDMPVTSQQATIIKKEHEDKEVAAVEEENAKCHNTQAVEQQVHATSTNKINATATNGISTASSTQTEENGNAMQLENVSDLPHTFKLSNINDVKMQKASPNMNFKYLGTSSPTGVSNENNIQNNKPTTLSTCKDLQITPTNTKIAEAVNCNLNVETSADHLVPIKNEGISANNDTIYCEEIISDTEEMMPPPLKKSKKDQNISSENSSNNCNEENEVLCLVKCPSCSSVVEESDINSHLNGCLEVSAISLEDND